MPEPSPHSVLIVEDERIVAKDLQQTLAAMGYATPVIASSADEAMHRAAEHVPDLVLMDIRIKGSHDGIETAEMLRGKFGVPVVYLTAHADDATLERARRTVPYGYLMKPIKPAELRSAIEVSIHRHRMEKQLRERERWFATTLRSIDDAVIAVDLAGEITFMNAAAEQLTGVTAQHATGRAAREVIRLAHGAHPASPLDDVLAHRRQLTITDAALDAPEGAGRIISGTASLVMDADDVLGVVLVARDVTEHRRVQRQLEVADRLASLGTLTSGVAHQINNPLAVVLANASYARNEIDDIAALAATIDDPAGALGDRLRELSQIQSEVAAAAARIGKIVADLKLFARPPEHVPGTTDVCRAIEWAVRTTAHEFRHRARLREDIAATLLAIGDEARLRQVFVNLLLNAAQAIPPGSADGNEIAIRGRSEAGRIVVEVHDTGPGILPGTLRRIFEPFFTTRAIGEGTGLGLSVCHGIVTSMGGTIEVDSGPGRGTLFRVTLQAAAAAGPPVPLPVASTGTGPAVARRGRVLVINDDAMVHRTLRRLLRDHDLVCTDNPREALAILERDPPFDFILSELMMPVMTGMAFHAALAARDPELASRIVFVTGGAAAGPDAEAFLRAQPHPALEKPFGMPEIQAVVARMLGGAT